MPSDDSPPTAPPSSHVTCATYSLELISRLPPGPLLGKPTAIKTLYLFKTNGEICRRINVQSSLQTNNLLPLPEVQEYPAMKPEDF
jgi:hypothetical protein